MSAATAALDAVSHNLANMHTDGFKASTPILATQTPATQSVGWAPSAVSGGGNPVQTGTGVFVLGDAIDESPAPLVVSGGEQASARRDGLVEFSNTDAGEELVNLILASGQFRANASVFESAGGLLDELVQLGRK